MKWKQLISAAAPVLLVIMVVAYYFAGRESIPEALVVSRDVQNRPPGDVSKAATFSR